MRRVRRSVSDDQPAEDDAPVHRARRPPRTVIPTDVVSVEVLVSAKIVRGAVSEDDFAAWVQEAVAHYHRWRNGWVGIGAIGSVYVPEVTVIEDS